VLRYWGAIVSLAFHHGRGDNSTDQEEVQNRGCTTTVIGVTDRVNDFGTECIWDAGRSKHHRSHVPIAPYDKGQLDALKCGHQLTEKGLVLFIMNLTAIVQVYGADDDAPGNDTGPMSKL